MLQLYCVTNAAAKKEGESFAGENVWEDVPKIRDKWGMHYFSIEGNDHLINMFTEEKDAPISVLEIGCDCGATLMKVNKTAIVVYFIHFSIVLENIPAYHNYIHI